ncbi:hypothetical protein DHEL01_v202318 [Diaporthe helianthi]|uniref:Uncharacterized protein n=1 Tax=Diaporthe helianthi TaxID=158607 RepID=A0A2P5I9V2_DIAHE|nr:hypothetical protein DHEL01_v202318 [Diaporthe helianthi]
MLSQRLTENIGGNRYAAIDFGSTSTRAYLTTVNKKTRQMNGYRVQKTGVDDDKKKRFLRGEWPSKGCPFDAPYPVGYDAAGREHADKRDRSLKSFVWFLADDDDQHPYTRDLKDFHDSLPGVQEQQRFRKRLMNMLVRHLAIVADQILQEAILRQTTIQRLVFCVPNAWDKPNFQAVLRPIMDKVAGGVETYCVFESEALSQFILHQHPYLLTDKDFVLVCDFGGHFMGGSLFQFCRDGAEDEHPAFFSLPQGNFGIRGGSQLWEDHIRPYIDAHINALGLPAERASVLRAKFLDAFFISKIEVDAAFYARKMPMRLVVSITDAFPDDTNLYPLYLKPAEILQAWQLGFRTSIDLALEKIRLLPVSSRGKTVVILSGGSMQNYHARTEIQQVCEKYRIECQAVGFDVNVESSKWMVCEGASTSEACALSPREFFRRGAAIAVQSYTKNGVYKTNAEVLFYGARPTRSYIWGSHAPHSTGQLEDFEYDLGSPVEIELGGYAHNKVRLVCEPLYQRNCHRYPKGCISIQSDDAAVNNNCYDIWDVSRRSEQTHANGTKFGMRIPPGRYLIEVESIEYYDNEADASLNLRLTRQQDVTGPSPARVRKNLRARTMSRGQEVYTFDLPLTSCGSSNLVLLDLDQVKNRLWKPRQARTPLPQLIPEQESGDEVSPAAKRLRVEVPPAEEPHDGTPWAVAGFELPAKSQQQDSELVATKPPQVPTPDTYFAPAGSPPAVETRDETAEAQSRGGSPEIGPKITSPSTASLVGVHRDSDPTPRVLTEKYVRIPETSDVWDRSDSGADSDSDYSDNIDNIVSFAAFPVGT